MARNVIGANGAGGALPAQSEEPLTARPCHQAVHALRVIEGERKARDYLARLQASQAEPDELALIVSTLYGPVLRGFCAAITKALRGGTS